MSLPGQRVQPERYQVIPRTLTFLLADEEILLVQIAPDRGAWAGLYNGVGGHIEPGENPYSAAIRELKEETGITPRLLYYSGVILVETGGSPGIAVHIFVGHAEKKQPIPSEEGMPRWIALAELDSLALVTDLPTLIPRALQSFHERQPFCGLTTFDADGHPHIQFLP